MHAQFFHSPRSFLTLSLALALAPAALALAEPATDLVCVGCVQATDLGANSVDSTKITNGAVGTADLAANSVDAAKIRDGSVGTADLAANSVDAAKIRDGSVGTADLAANSVDAAKIKDGSVGTADLNATLLARLTSMEARLAALEGAAYSKATFKGTYRCIAFSGGSHGNAVFGQTYAGVNFESSVTQITADGAGSLTASRKWKETGRTWWLQYRSAAKTYFLATKSETHAASEEAETIGYNVDADGKLTFSPAPEGGVINEGWIGRNGDTVVLRWMENWVEGNRNGVTSDVSACVRTAR